MVKTDKLSKKGTRLLLLRPFGIFLDYNPALSPIPLTLIFQFGSDLMASASSSQALEVNKTLAAREKMTNLIHSLENAGINRKSFAEFMKRSIEEEESRQEILTQAGALDESRYLQLLEAKVILAAIS